MICSGARIVVECLVEQGVDTVFGFPGGSVLNLYDELYRQSDRIRHVLTAHEQGAAHAADGYARASGKVGVVMATSGPGATNLVTGIATAFMDSIPMVAITGNVPTWLLGKDSFQEIDIAGITMPITKHSFMVKDPGSLAAAMRRAFAIARSGRPGPVLVDIPKDVLSASADWEREPVPARSFVARGAPAASDAELDDAAALLSAARNPLMIAGGGVIASGASGELRALAERLDAPVALTLMGQGAFPAAHPLCTGMIGMHGTKASNMAVKDADLILAIGTRFSDRVIGDGARFATGAHVLHVDVDPAEIGKNIPCYRPLVGDVRDVLSRMLERVERRERPVWKARIAGWSRDVPSHPPACGLDPRMILGAVREAFGEDAVITTEVGQHQVWTAQYYPFSRPRTFISSCGLGTMGFGTGAAIGAQLACPGSRVVHVAGDGSFRMNSTELATIARYSLPIVILVMNNGALGMVRQWQTMFYGGRYAETGLGGSPDFVKLAEAYGIRASRPADGAALEAALAVAAASSEPVLLDCAIDADACVLPIVPPGKPLEEQVMKVVN